jgi:hypothetical protein
MNMDRVYCLSCGKESRFDNPWGVNWCWRCGPNGIYYYGPKDEMLLKLARAGRKIWTVASERRLGKKSVG